MPIIKVSPNHLNQPKLVVASDLKTFKEKAEAKLGYPIDRIVRHPDGSEIDDDDVFEELIKEKGELWLICLKKNDEYPFIELKPEEQNLTTNKEVSAENQPPIEQNKEESSVEIAPKEEQSDENSLDKAIATFLNEKSSIFTEEEELSLDKINTDDLMRTMHTLMTDKIEDIQLFSEEEIKNLENLENSQDNDIIASLKTIITSHNEEHPIQPLSTFKQIATKIKLQANLITKLKVQNNQSGEDTPSNHELIEKLKSTLLNNNTDKVLLASKMLSQLQTDEKQVNIEEKKESIDEIPNKIEDATSADEIPTQTEEQIKKTNLFVEIMKAEKVDICFLIDCTGSMKPYIEKIKETLNKIIDKLKIKFTQFDLRLALVGYRDHSDAEKRITVFPFSTDIESLKSFIDEIRAGGGADQAEDVFGGIDQVNKLEWSNPSRILLHIADAPCHGIRFHDEDVTDDYPGGDPNGLNITDLLKELSAKNISYYFALLSQTCSKMIQEFNKELVQNNSKKIKLFKFPSVDDLTELITKTIITVINESKTIAMNSSNSLETKHVQLTNEQIDWSPENFQKVNAIQYDAKFTGTVLELKSKPIEFTEKNVEVLIAEKPFEKGSVRYAYAALVNNGTSDKPNYVKHVVKQCIFVEPQFNTLKYYKDLVENQVVSGFLANKFFEITEPQKSLRFIDVNVLYVPETNSYYSIEEYIEGDFVKWISNNGIINEDIYSCTLDSFSHWSYEVTNKYLIVTDLQGTLISDKDYILTDPAITCPDDPDRFTNTNLGAEGMKNFFQSHQCNHICKFLLLNKHELQTLPDRADSVLMTKLADYKIYL